MKSIPVIAFLVCLGTSNPVPASEVILGGSDLPSNLRGWDPGSSFGAAAAVSGDHAVIGAPNKDLNVNTGGSSNYVAYAGAVYIFSRSGGAWSETQIIDNPYPDRYSPEHFGKCVAMDGDTVVIGAPEDDMETLPNTPGDLIGAGSVFVYVRSGNTWTLQQRLLAPDANDFDDFGASVDISGDSIIVGAPGENGFPDSLSLNERRGSAYVFTRSGGKWTHQAQLRRSSPQIYDVFGSKVAISGDVAVVTASEGGTKLGGAAIVFTRFGSTWTEGQTLRQNTATAAAGFGASVDASGDTIVVGHPKDNQPTFEDGAAYVYKRAGGSWYLQQKLLNPHPTLGDRYTGTLFGGAVSISGNTVLVGASRQHGLPGDLKTLAGAAYLYTRAGKTWAMKQIFAGETAGDLFGSAVAVSGATGIGGATQAGHGGSDPPGMAKILCNLAPANRLNWQHRGWGTVVLWNLRGNEVSGGAPLSRQVRSVDWKLVANGDLNGDRVHDLLWQNRRTGSVAWWYVDPDANVLGTGLIRSQVNNPQWQASCMGDLNGDGHSDLLWQHRPTGTTIVWYLKDLRVVGTGFIGRQAGKNWRAAALEDFNGDGNLDIVWQHRVTDQVAIWYLGGTSPFRIIGGGLISAQVPNNGQWVVAGAQDVNGDAWPDLVWQNRVHGTVVNWFLAGRTVLGGSLLGSQVNSPVWEVRNNRALGAP